MAETTFLHRLLGRMREKPVLYETARRLYRRVNSAPREILRVLAPTGCPRVGPPKGKFSALAMLEAGEVGGRVGWRDQDTPRASPDSMMVRCGFRQDQYQPWPAFWTRHREMRLVGSSRLPMDATKRICAEAIYGSFETDPGFNYLALPRATRLAGPWANLVSGHFYHWLHEELPRLWALAELPPETGLLIPENAPAYVWDTLRWLGLEGRARPTAERHLVVEDFYFLAPTVMQGCPNPAGLRFLREQFLPQADRSEPGPRRIYLARANKTRGILNAGEVEEFFQARGWAIVNPEELTLARQIAVFAGAEVICGLHGAAFSNLAWCRPGCRVLELFSDGFLNGCYEGMALCLDLPYRWLVFPADGEFQSTVDTTQIATLLREWAL